MTEIRQNGPFVGLTLPSREELVSVRAFVRERMYDAAEPITVISGSRRLGVWLPESWFTGPGSRTAHPEGDADVGGTGLVSPDAPTVVGPHQGSVRGVDRERPAGADGTDEQSGVPEQQGAPEPRRVRGAGSHRPAPQRSTQAVLDRAAKEGRRGSR